MLCRGFVLVNLCQIFAPSGQGARDRSPIERIVSGISAAPAKEAGPAVQCRGGLLGLDHRPGALQAARGLRARGHGICSISAGCAHLARRLSGPALERMRECAHLMKAKQPGNLGYMQLAVVEVANR
jgi:hypothetical protein